MPRRTTTSENTNLRYLDLFESHLYYIDSFYSRLLRGRGHVAGTQDGSAPEVPL